MGFRTRPSLFCHLLRYIYIYIYIFFFFRNFSFSSSSFRFFCFSRFFFLLLLNLTFSSFFHFFVFFSPVHCLDLIVFPMPDMGSQHPSPHKKRKPLSINELHVWLAIITSHDAQNDCFHDIMWFFLLLGWRFVTETNHMM